jgi:hypothetical protein
MANLSDRLFGALLFVLFAGMLLILGRGCIAKEVNSGIAETPGSGSILEWCAVFE